jgi:hypothetical protein
MKSNGPISTTFTDAPCPKPSAGSAEGLSFGNPLAGQGPTKTDGILEEVQYSNSGPAAGGKDLGIKIPGGGSY